MSRRKKSGLFASDREKLLRANVEVPPVPGTLADARARAAATLELARALHHLEAAKARKKKPGPKVGAEGPPRTRGGVLDYLQALDIIRSARADLTRAQTFGSAPGPILTRASQSLIALQRLGVLTEAQSNTAFERILAHFESIRNEVKGMSKHSKDRENALLKAYLSNCMKQITVSGTTDLPPELGSYSDGVSDDAAFHPELVGCGPGCGSIGAELLVGAHHGIPGYLFTRKGLSNTDVRLRIASHIRAMTPKLRRRVLSRLREAVTAARVMNRPRISGEVRNAYASVAGWSAVSGQPSIAIGRCPYANVAGALTP